MSDIAPGSQQPTTRKQAQPIACTHLGSNVFCLADELATGEIADKRTYRIIRPMNKHDIIIEIYTSDGKDWDSYLFKAEDLFRSLAYAACFKHEELIEKIFDQVN